MNFRIMISAIVFGVVAIVLGWVYESQFKSTVASAELEIPNNIDYFLTHLDYRVSNAEGKLDYEFSSPRLEHRPRTDVSHIESPSLQIYRVNEQWQVNSEQGQFHHRNNILVLQQNVVLQKLGDDPLRVTTETIQFEPDRNLVTMPDKVMMRSNSARIEAEQATFDLTSKVYLLQKARTVYSNDKS